MSVSWSSDYEPEADYYETSDSYVAVNSAWDRFVENAEAVVADDAPPPREQIEPFLRLVEPTPAEVSSTRCSIQVAQNKTIDERIAAAVILVLRHAIRATLNNRELDLSEYIETIERELKQLKRLHRSEKKKPKRLVSAAQLTLI